MKKKQILANGLVRFFKLLKVSFLIGIITSILLYLIVFDGYKSQETVRRELYEKPKIEYGSKLYNRMSFFWKNELYMKQENTNKIMKEIDDSITEYRKGKISMSVFYGFLITLGLPVLIILVKQSYFMMKSTNKWISENKTI